VWVPVFPPRGRARATAPSAFRAPPFSDEYWWEQGEPPVSMGSVHGRVCFLTRLRGDFEGGGEYVRAFASGGSWYLGGGSQQSGVEAAARCLSVHWYSSEYFWTQGQAPVPLYSAGYYSCFLTGLSGDFEGGGEVVRTFVDDKGWFFLGGSSGQSGVWATARCV
jgi:hypothetical protein